MENRKSQIPIKNFFYMLCYAWNTLAIMDEVKVDKDDYNDAYNLLARVFTFGISKLVRSGFHRSYMEEQEELSVLRGKIAVQESINKMSMKYNKLFCTFDEYSKNDIFNQIIKYTIDNLMKNRDISVQIKSELKRQRIFFNGIESKPPTKENRQKLVYNRNSIIYKMLIDVAIMLYDGTAVNEENGQSTFKDFFREEQMHRVFELFILNFYGSHLDRSTYHVHAPKISWHMEKDTANIWGSAFDVDMQPGERRTDIVIENKQRNLQMIFDAKYYKNTLVQAYMNAKDENVRTSHLNQLRGYILDSDYKGKKVGALLYPMVNVELNRGKVFPIQDAPIIIKTINLNDEWRNIENDLLSFLQNIEKVQY